MRRNVVSGTTSVLLLLLVVSCAKTPEAEPIEVSVEKPAPVVSEPKPAMSLFDAAREGRLDEVELNLSNGAKVNEKNSDGATALHLAAGMNHAEVVTSLLDHGADKEAKSAVGGQTPLHLAAFLDATGAVKVLLNRKAKIEATDENGNTPLLLAAAENAQGAALLLLEAGARTEARTTDNVGGTPLFAAAYGGHREMVELLLAKGAKANAKTKRGSTAAAIADELGYTDIAQIIRAFGQ